MRSSASYTIETNSLNKRFGKFTALQNLNIKIQSGSCVGFLGPNGAGKTTTIKILTGLIRPTRGNAYLNGIDITKDPLTALRSVGAVVEMPEFYPYLTPLEILEYFGTLRGMSKEEIKYKSQDVLYLVKLHEWSDKKIGTFSRGMKQRLAIAQALLHDPEILILDEPASGLDPRGIYEMRQLFSKLKKEGKTIFLSSHILTEVEGVCDSIILLNKGRVMLYDKIENIAKLKLLKISVKTSESVAENHIEEIKKVKGVEFVRYKENKMIIYFKGSEKERAELLKELHSLGLEISLFRPEKFSLEDLYLSLIKKSER